MLDDLVPGRTAATTRQGQAACIAAQCRLTTSAAAQPTAVSACRGPRSGGPRQPSPSPFGPCLLSALAPPLQPATRDEQSRRRPRLGHGPDGRGGRGRGAEAEVAAAEGGRRRLQPRRQFLLPHQHRPSQRSASAQLAGGLPDGDARRPHGTFSRLSVEISVGT